VELRASSSASGRAVRSARRQAGPTYIADAQPDVFAMLLATIGAFALAHVAAGLQERRAMSS
jgi:hypothetical protein